MLIHIYDIEDQHLITDHIQLGWYRRETCQYIGEPVEPDEKPVAYFCIDDYAEYYEEYFERKPVFRKYVIKEPFPMHVMSMQQIAELFRVIPVRAGVYEDQSIKFAGFNSYGSLLYDVSDFKPFKTYRLKKLFE